MHFVRLLRVHADGDAGGVHGHCHDHGHLGGPGGGGARQHLHDHHLRFHDGEGTYRNCLRKADFAIRP